MHADWQCQMNFVWFSPAAFKPKTWHFTRSTSAVVQMDVPPSPQVKSTDRDGWRIYRMGKPSPMGQISHKCSCCAGNAVAGSRGNAGAGNAAGYSQLWSHGVRCLGTAGKLHTKSKEHKTQSLKETSEVAQWLFQTITLPPLHVTCTLPQIFHGNHFQEIWD